MTNINWKLSVALVSTVSLSVALLTPAHARPMIAELEVEEVSSVDDAPVCESEDSIIDGLLGSFSDDELESLYQQNNPKFAEAFNSCVDNGGNTSVCEEEAMELALLAPKTEFTSFQEEPKKPTTPRRPARTPEQVKAELRKAMREHVFLMVNLYWMKKDMVDYGYWDQDGDGIADRLDRDSYNGHGVTKAYPRPIPGARADGHYNCEYFAQYFREAFVTVFGQDEKGNNTKNECWKIEYNVHATIAFYYEYKGNDIYVFVEPQGGSAWFISMPTLPINSMPARGQNGRVNGIMCYNTDKNAWFGNARRPGAFALPPGIMDKLEGKTSLDDVLPDPKKKPRMPQRLLDMLEGPQETGGK